VTARIQRLEDAGVIEGYCARVNPKCLGREISAFIRLKTTQPEFHHCLKAFERIPQILEIYRLTGEDCFLVKATFETMSQLESTIDTLAKHGNSTTTMILASYPPRPLTDSGATLDGELREELNFQGRR